jgi:hypothetical protein
MSLARSLSFLLALAVPAIALAHPHFPKRVEMALGFGKDAPRIAVEHLTVTFDAKGAEEMKEGETWHLAGAKFEAPIDLEVGGKKFTKGDYRLLTRKTGNGFELLLDVGGDPFSRDVSEKAVAITTEFMREQPREEHLHVDLHPAGDDDEPALYLEVRFDDMKARARIVVPAE